MCFLKAEAGPRRWRRPTPAPVTEIEAEAAFHDAQAAHGHDSAEALVAYWCWRRVRNRGPKR